MEQQAGGSSGQVWGTPCQLTASFSLLCHSKFSCSIIDRLPHAGDTLVYMCSELHIILWNPYSYHVPLFFLGEKIPLLKFNEEDVWMSGPH